MAMPVMPLPVPTVPHSSRQLGLAAGHFTGPHQWVGGGQHWVLFFLDVSEVEHLIFGSLVCHLNSSPRFMH